MRWLTLGCLAAAGCALAGRNVTRPPLQDEGEVALMLAPLPDPARGLSFEVKAVSALRADGTRVPLTVALRTLSRPELQRERLLARGVLPPGAWRGFELELARPQPAEPVTAAIDVPFVISPRRGVVVTAQAVSAAPAFTASQPHQPLPQVLAVCTNEGTNDLTVFDKRARTTGALLPTGREPAGAVFDAANNRIYVALEGDHTVSVIDATTLEEHNRIRLTPGDGPRDLVLTADGRTLLTANAGSNSVSFVDTASMIETARVVVGEEPTFIVLDRRGARAFVSNLRANTISVLDLAARVVVTTLSTDDQPLRAQINRAGNRLYVVHRSSPFLAVFSLPELTPVKRVYIGPAIGFLKLDPNTDLLYVSRRDDTRIQIYDGFGLLPVDSIDAPGAAGYMAIADAENVLFLVLPGQNRVAAIELASKRLVGTIDVGEDPRQLAIAGERY